MISIARLFILLTTVALSACSTNPVTGEKQLLFTSAQEEIAIGNNQYKPAQQSQGGRYYADPELNVYVSEVGRKLAAVSHQPDLPYEFVVLNNSIPNAWALPSGKIAINRGLLVKLENEAQLASVLGHEIVHAAARHGAQRMRDNLLMQAGLAGLGLTLVDNDYRQLIVGGAALGASLTVAKYGRDHELESDLYGMEYMAKAGYDLQGAVELQELFVELSSGKQGNWLQGLFASHPPSQERVDENKKTAQRLQKQTGQKPFTGEKEYQNAMSYLLSKQAAYEHGDKAAAALHKKELKNALTEINKAIKIEPKEALFYSLKGEILEQQGDSTQASKAHDKAVELHPDQFSYYLKRAKTLENQGKLTAAEADYKKSMALLPTSIAALELGQLAENTGKPQQAISYYQQASTALGAHGKQAQFSLAKLEIKSRPEKYFHVTHTQDPVGPLLVYIENRSPFDAAKLELISELYNSQGQLLKKERWTTTHAIKAGKRSRYYPVPVVYHLDPSQRIKTYVTKAITQ